MKHWVYPLIISGCLGMTSNISLAQINPILATVYDKPITQLDLAAQKQWTSANDVDEEDLLDSLIQAQVLEHAAEQAHVQVSERDIDQAIERIQSQPSNAQGPSLENWLSSQNIALSTYREKIRQQLLRAKLESQQYVSPISEADTTAFLDDPKSWRHLPVAFKVAHALIPTDNTDALQAFQACGTDQACFEHLARQYSTTRSAAQGGALGWRTFNDLPDILAQAISDTPQYGTLAAVSTEAGVHFIQIQQVRIAEQWVRPMVTFDVLMLSPEQAQAKDTLMQLSEDHADLAQYAKTHQQWHRQINQALLTEPLVERYPMLQDLKPGEYSKPFKTPLGWKMVHLKQSALDPYHPKLWAFYAEHWLTQQARAKALDDWQQHLMQEANVTYWPHTDSDS